MKMNTEDKVYTLEVSNSAKVWEVLNKTHISHVVESERNDSMTLEFTSTTDHDSMIDELRDELGSRAFPEDKWPSYAVVE
jgi:hypothetical protein